MSETLYAGFARVNVVPEMGGIPLAGYSGFNDTANRLASRILDPIYANVVAVGNGEDTCLFITIDICELHYNVFYPWRKAICEATGLPEDRIFMGSTHTHASVDIRSDLPSVVHYNETEMPPKLTEAAKRAIADMLPAKLSYGTMETGTPGHRLNWTRHYYCVEKGKETSFTLEDLLPALGPYQKKSLYPRVGHEGVADHNLHIIRFSREDADDILLLNFTAHATITGGTFRGDLSADYPGTMIASLEERVPGVKCCFLQGCCGNIIPETRMEQEGILGLTCGKNCDHRAYGSVMARYAMEILDKHMQDSESNAFACVHRNYSEYHDHSMDDLAPKALPIIERSKQLGGTAPEVKELCEKNGFLDIYHCLYAYRKSRLPDKGTFEINAIRLGDCAITTNPFEMFSETGIHIKENSPFAMTMMDGFSCGYENYLPVSNTFEESYEVHSTLYELGTAERLEKQYHEMLCELYDMDGEKEND